MFDALFRGLFDTDMTARISVFDFLLCIDVSLALALLFAFVLLATFS